MNPGTPFCVLLGNPFNGGRVHRFKARRLARPSTRPANLVTLGRAVLAVVVAGLVALSFVQAVPDRAVVTIAAVALALDWVDGQVARRTNSVTAFGARFDMEVDAFLILVLSVYVARDFGLWVLLIGLARYLLLAAEQVWPWLRRPVPPRYWRKVVAAVQGVVLTVAAADVVPHALMELVLVVALLLLAESFGRDVAWLAGRSLPVGTFLSVVLLWAVLVAPDQLDGLHPWSFLRLPAELLVLAAVALLLPGRCALRPPWSWAPSSGSWPS